MVSVFQYYISGCTYIVSDPQNIGPVFKNKLIIKNEYIIKNKFITKNKFIIKSNVNHA